MRDFLAEALSARIGSGKMSPPQAGYTDEGPYPFVCDNCVHMDDQAVCEIVEGPHEGRVQPDGACKYWAMTREAKQAEGPVPGEGDGDKVHVAAEPGEYVLTKDMVSDLGPEGEAALEDWRVRSNTSRRRQ